MDEHKSSVDINKGSQNIDSSKSDPLWLIGTDSVETSITDLSANHDDYLYGPLSESAKAEMEGKKSPRNPLS